MDGRSDREAALVNNIGPVTITTPGDRQIVVTRLFDAPRALVFEAWTKSEHVAHWWDPSGVPLAVCEIDLRPCRVIADRVTQPGAVVHRAILI